MKHLFIINPAAGKGKGVRFVEDIKNYFRCSDEPYKIEFTDCPGDATIITNKYVNEDQYRVYSIGGDGTLNEVLNGIVNSTSSLAVIPSGSGNDFFRNINDIFDETLLYRTINGTEKYIDIGKVNDHYFLNVASAGIDAAVVHNSTRFKKLPFFNGMSAYAAGVFYTVFKYKSFNSKININSTEFNKETLLFAVANGMYYGGGMKIAPSADIFDNQLEVYHIDKVNPFKIILLFPQLIKGNHESIKEVTHYSSRKVMISSQEGFLLNIDGEVSRVNEANFEVIPAGIKLVFPAEELSDNNSSKEKEKLLIKK